MERNKALNNLEHVEVLMFGLQIPLTSLFYTKKSTEVNFSEIYLFATALPLFPTTSSWDGLFSDAILWLDML